MILIVFRSRLRKDADMQELGILSQRMYELATAMAGFINYKDYSGEDGESVTIVEFASMGDLLLWRHHPEHVVAQERGRREFFAEYNIQVCHIERSYEFDSRSHKCKESDHNESQ